MLAIEAKTFSGYGSGVASPQNSGQRSSTETSAKADLNAKGKIAKDVCLLPIIETPAHHILSPNLMPMTQRCSP
jgi:hypothetical protein